MRQPIVFVTDYGRDDAYAAALTGAAWRVDPDVRCIEGTHGIPAGDVLAGAYHLKALALAFAGAVVFCAVVDPEVGTHRRAIAIEVGPARCVAPDNGLVSYLWDEAPPDLRRAVRIHVPAGASATFHGRDVFAPAAAALAAGAGLDALGDRIDDPAVLAGAFAAPLPTGLQGRVSVVDHFGNAITTIRSADVGSGSIRSVTWSSGTCGIVGTYADIGPDPQALFGSAGHLEVAARGRPVASAGGPRAGDAVMVELG